jgi:hypothetical protein
MSHGNPLEPEAASGDASACLRWLHVNLVLSRGIPLSEEQLRQLSRAVGDDAVRLPMFARRVCFRSR